MAGQDYKRTIPAGGSTRINANGETYAFCKFSDRDVTVDIAGRKVVMRSGSYMEFAPLRGENSAITIFNEDTENPAAVVFVLGVGTYDEKIIRGEVNVTPTLKTASGISVTDSRHTIDIHVDFIGEEVTETAATALKNAETATGLAGNAGSVFLWGDRVYVRDDGDLGNLGVYDTEGNYIGVMPITDNGDAFVGFPAYAPDSDLWAYVIDGDGKNLYRLNKYTGAYSRIATPAQMSGATDRFGVGAARDAVFHPPTREVLFTKGDSGIMGINVDTLHVTEYIVNEFGNPGGWTGITYVPTEKKVLVSTGSDYRTVRITEAGPSEEEKKLNYGNAVSLQFVGSNRLWRTSPNPYPTIYVYDDVTFQATGYAVDNGASVALLATPKSRTKAVVYTDNDTAPRKAAGEVIRAALDLWRGPQGYDADYLDFIHRLTWFDGNRRRVLDTGGQTFKAAKVKDEFIVQLPGVIHLTIRNGLLKE